MAHMKLGEVLIAAGAITQEQLQEGLELQKVKKKRLGATLISNGIISENQLIEALQMQLGLDFVELSEIKIPSEMAQLVSKSFAVKNQLVPYKIDKGDLYVAMVDPLNFFATEEIRKTTRKRVIPVLATTLGIRHAITTLYGNEGARQAIMELKKESADDDSVDNAFVSTILGNETSADAPTVRLVNSIIERAIDERASDIHLEPREYQMNVRMRIDGVMRNILIVPKDIQPSVISRIKVMCGMDIAERRVPQDGRCNVKSKLKDIDMRVSTLPTVYGEKVVMRLLDKSGGMLNKEAIGLKGDDLEKFNRLIHCHHGVVLIVGPTGSGKSSTMYTMIGELNQEEVNLVTLEDPVEYNIDGINQVQINEKTGMTFASGLRAILRQDPDIVAVGEIRDGETADIAMRAAITGHVVLSTIHTSDSTGTIDRLIDIGVEPYLIAGALRGVISQRLVRRICPYCKTAYKPDAAELRALGLPAGDYTFHKGEGCPECFETGYRGRIAVFEIMNVNKKIRDLILERKTRKFIEEELNREGSDYVSLQKNAIKLVLEGTTTVEEVMRVTTEMDE